MKVFISWSGDRSKQVAELLDDWIQCVIQAVDPWMSSKDIDRGALWFTEITDQLANTSIGIVCLTKENKSKPWILFESGALAKGLTSNRVCTFLIDLIPTDLENPLAQFNHTFPTKDSIWELVRTINLSLKEKSLKESVLSKVFDTYWPQFENDFSEIMKSSPDTAVTDKRKDNDIMLDVLTTVRMLDKRLRVMETSGKSSRRSKAEEIDPDMARSLIKSYLAKGLEPKAIAEILQPLGPPMDWTLKRIDEFTSDNNKD